VSFLKPGLKIFANGNIVPIIFPNIFLKGINYLFYFNAGDKNITPSYLKAWRRASLKQIAPPILEPDK
jgi:hypothetical protein